MDDGLTAGKMLGFVGRGGQGGRLVVGWFGCLEVRELCRPHVISGISGTGVLNPNYS